MGLFDKIKNVVKDVAAEKLNEVTHGLVDLKDERVAGLASDISDAAREKAQDVTETLSHVDRKDLMREGVGAVKDGLTGNILGLVNRASNVMTKAAENMAQEEEKYDENAEYEDEYEADEYDEEYDDEEIDEDAEDDEAPEEDEDLEDFEESVMDAIEEGEWDDETREDLLAQAEALGITQEQLEAMIDARIQEYEAQKPGLFGRRRGEHRWRRCPNCGALCWIEDEYCDWCGYQLRTHPLMTAAAIVARRRMRQAGRPVGKRPVAKRPATGRPAMARPAAARPAGARPAAARPMARPAARPAAPAKTSLFGSKTAAPKSAPKRSLFGGSTEKRTSLLSHKSDAAPKKRTSLLSHSSSKSSGGLLGGAKKSSSGGSLLGKAVKKGGGSLLRRRR